MDKSEVRIGNPNLPVLFLDGVVDADSELSNTKCAGRCDEKGQKNKEDFLSTCNATHLINSINNN